MAEAGACSERPHTLVANGRYLMTNPVQEVQRLGQSIWYDNIRRGLITSGKLQKLIDLGVSGLTSNPTIFEKAIAGSTDYDEALVKLSAEVPSAETKDAGALFEALALEDIQAAADLLRPTYDRTGGADGFASLEVSPNLAHDTDGTVKEAQRLFAALDRPNVMVKVPATPEGIPAIRRLIGEGINVNVTLIFSLDYYRDVKEAYISGLEDLADSGGDVSNVSSVASFFISRVDAAIDGLLEKRIRDGNADVAGLLGKAAIANAKLAYRDFQETFEGERFAALRAKGGRVQRPLWASTGTKSPAYSDVLYLDSLIGPDTVNTVPEATLTAFIDHGVAAETLKTGVREAEAAVRAVEQAGISMESVTAKLLEDGLQAFNDSYDKLLANLVDKQARLLAGRHEHPGVDLGDYLPDVDAAIADLDQKEVVDRIWRGDHTVWKPDPEELTNRLGWLNVTEFMCEQLPILEAFADEVREAGFRHVVLLGMGGSSLGPEVLRQSFGHIAGYPELIVLDSTVPSWIKVVTDRIDPSKTLFLVSSKSGSTIEPNSFYRYFRSLVETAVGKEKAGKNFVAVTDPGTVLEKLGREEGFRRIFGNPPDIGGRYSVLSYFGLVPAVITGVDIAALLDTADCMREGCASCVPVHDNPGASLGAAMGTLALKGRDKLTIVTSPSIGGFGLWAEQLIAESLGKEGKGVVPIAGEPLESPAHYGDDRFFVYLRVENDDNAPIDAAIKELNASGQPVIRLDLRDRSDLGAEFFRWEFATAVAGRILGVHPFDQPNVQAAKDITSEVLKEYQSLESAPGVEPVGSIRELLSQSRKGSYLAVMAYVTQTPEVDQAMTELRRKVMERYQVATTFGYGPRFLHSTGQLHKGGPDSGMFLQITASHKEDIAVPGAPFSFGILADAQAKGDLGALKSQGRRVASVTVEGDIAASIRKLVEEEI